MEISARNVLQGVVTSVVHGAVNSEVTIEVAGEVEIVSIIPKDSAEKLNLSQVKIDVGGQQITSIITSDAARGLGLKNGVAAYALVKATAVMVIRG